jgi:hypothetical protein
VRAFGGDEGQHNVSIYSSACWKEREAGGNADKMSEARSASHSRRIAHTALEVSCSVEGLALLLRVAFATCASAKLQSDT